MASKNGTIENLPKTNVLSISPKQLLSPHVRTVAPHQLVVWAQRGPVRALNTVTVTVTVVQ